MPGTVTRSFRPSASQGTSTLKWQVDSASLDELLVTIKSELVKLGPHIGLDPNQLLLGTENRSPVTVKRTGGEFAAAPSVAEHGCLVGVELTALCRALGGRWRGFGAEGFRHNRRRSWRMRGPRRAARTSREANFNTTPATVCRTAFGSSVGESSGLLPAAFACLGAVPAYVG